MEQEPWEEAADCLRILSHPHRLQMIDFLLTKERSVGELAKLCGLLDNVTSEHLSLMKHKGFIKPKKRGRYVFYEVEEAALASIMGCIKRRFFE